MLRITAKKEGEKIRVLYLEGKICQEWGNELQAEIEKGIRKGEKIILDFLRVHYLDEAAARMLGHFSSPTVTRRNCSLFIQKMLSSENRRKE